MPPDSPPQPSERAAGSRLTPEERASYMGTALEMRARGSSKAAVCRALGIQKRTLESLLDEAAGEISPRDRVRKRAEIETSIMAVKRRAWTELDRREALTAAQKRAGMRADERPRIIKPTSHTLPALLSRILESDDRLIQLYGLDRPEADTQPTETLAEKMKAYEEAKRTGKLSEIRRGAGSANGSVS